MHSPSRRLFLRGRRSAQTPWAQFCEHLRRMVTGEFIEFHSEGSAASGRLTIQRTTDIHHVRALCATYGVVLALDGLAAPARQADQHVVWVRPGKGLAQLKRLETNGNRWFVQPGCTLGELTQAGFQQFATLPAYTTLAVWLADRTLSDYAIGDTDRSGVEHISLLLGDGTTITLGPFGEHDTKPLDSLRLQQMVPALFQLVRSDHARACLAAHFWPAHYRLDALAEQVDKTINLAHLCLGHGGSLGWVEWVVLDADRLQLSSGIDDYFSVDRVEAAGMGDAAFHLDAHIKMLFDPDGIFSTDGQDL